MNTKLERLFINIGLHDSIIIESSIPAILMGEDEECNNVYPLMWEDEECNIPSPLMGEHSRAIPSPLMGEGEGGGDYI